MTNGPDAMLAEIVENPLPKDAGAPRCTSHPLYYAVRNHIIDFLVSRSRTFRRAGPAARSAPRAGGAPACARARGAGAPRGGDAAKRRG